MEECRRPVECFDRIQHKTVGLLLRPTILFSPVEMLPLCFLLGALLILTKIQTATPHQESGEWSCESDGEIRLVANFRPGIVTVDGRPGDWESVSGSEFDLLPALDPLSDKEYNGGKMIIKVLHDGINLYFLLQVDGAFVYSQSNSKKCPSVALMFPIGDHATYHNMGGCKESPGLCNSSSCGGREVDIMHFSIGNAIPGRLYGGDVNPGNEGNGGDRFGGLVDLYAWNPHCLYLDGSGPSGNSSIGRNDWKGAWWHTGLGSRSGFVVENTPYGYNGKKGTYTFEFSRPLGTMDRLQQDAQMTIGEATNVGVAFWYPVEGKPWHGSGHYSVSCDWVHLDISTPGPGLAKSTTGGFWDVASAFSVVFSLVSLCVSVYVGYSVSKNTTSHFIPMDTL